MSPKILRAVDSYNCLGKYSGVVVNIEDSLAYHVNRTGRLLRRSLMRLLVEHGFDVTPEQWFALNRLRRRHELSQVELSDPALGDAPNITRMLRAMERREHIERVRDPDDGRRTLVRLTALGERTHDAIAELVKLERARVFAGFSGSEIATALRVLEKLERKL